MERLYGLVFAAKRMVKGAATLTSFALARGLGRPSRDRTVGVNPRGHLNALQFHWLSGATSHLKI